MKALNIPREFSMAELQNEILHYQSRLTGKPDKVPRVS